MVKLIELLNEYEKKNIVHRYKRSDAEGVLTCEYKDGFIYYCEEASTIAISKYYGFIKWLVENDKIDLEEIGIDYGRIHLVGEKSGRQHIIRQDLARYEALLMLLSISDTPIEDLISYLK